MFNHRTTGERRRNMWNEIDEYVNNVVCVCPFWLFRRAFWFCGADYFFASYFCCNSQFSLLEHIPFSSVYYAWRQFFLLCLSYLPTNHWTILIRCFSLMFLLSLYSVSVSLLFFLLLLRMMSERIQIYFSSTWLQLTYTAIGDIPMSQMTNGKTFHQNIQIIALNVLCRLYRHYATIETK